uniref:Ubiquitin-like protease family profile domain-containing protein n=1 Tax=Chenopodium quinoa TaxID=63459 RepID=A0A803MIS8_CHEQI
MFTVASGKEFVVTKNDVCDLFCLPMGDIPVPKLKKNPKVASVDNCILQAWRFDFDVSDKQSIPLSKLESQMQELVDGGEAFKRFFVVHAMSIFLALTPNRIVSLKLLKAVEEVDEIKTFDWCSYVLRKLKKSVDKYKKDLTVQSMLRLRVGLEVKAGGFGQGPLDKSTYLLSQSAISQTVVKKPLTLGSDQLGLNVGGACSSGTIGRFVQFELPDGVMTDGEIKQISTHFRGEDGPERRNNEDVPCSGYNEDVPGPNEDVPEPPIRSNKSLCSLDCGLVGDNSNAVNNLHGIWERWVSYEKPECDIMDSELLDQLVDFLGKRDNPKSTQLPFYKFTIVDLEWRKTKIDYTDCGVFVMYHMLHFFGESFILNELKTICTTLVLCDMNESRADVLAEVPKFNERKKNADYVKGIEERLQ